MKNAWMYKQNLVCEVPQKMEASELDNVIVFVPHADDESIGCGGLIALLCQLQKKVTLVIVSDSSGDGGLACNAAEIRKKELEEAASILGITEDIIFWNIPDGQIASCSDLDLRINAISRQVNAEYALSPWVLDTHKDHASVGNAVLSAHKNGAFADGIWFYEVWTPLCATHILSINDVWDKKKKALSAHKTALECADYLRGTEGLAAYRSLLGSDLGREGTYAEGYHFYKHSLSKEVLAFRTASGCDGELITALFAKTFKTVPSPNWWEWKYRSKPLIGSVATKEDGEIVSFYGALDRIMIYNSKEYDVCQLSDVMVSQSLRGWGGKKGIFYHTSLNFLNQYVGDEKKFTLGYGFPTARALTLGVRLGLYQQADRLLHWHQNTVAAKRAFGIKIHPEKASDLTNWAWVDALCATVMFSDGAWMKKTAQYWKWRYGDHPDFDYTIVRVHHWGKIIAAFVVRKRENTLELIDIAYSNIKNYKTMLKTYAYYAYVQQIPTLSAWGTSYAIDSITSTLGGEAVDAGSLSFPGLMLNASIGNYVDGKLYLLGGDTDFR